VVTVGDDHGLTGFGSGDAMYGFDDYRAGFIGRDTSELATIDTLLANVSFHAGRAWPLSVAVHDLRAKELGQPLWKMLGGESGRLRLYASTAVHRSPEATVAAVLSLADAGFEAVKVRVGRPRLEDDLAVIEAVCASTTMRVMVDCNQGWRMPWDTAQPWSVDRVWPFAERLAELGVFWIEEPLDRGDYDGMAELRRRLTGSGLLVAGGEMTREPYEFRELLTRGCLDVYQPDVVCTNGVSGLAALARRVLDAGHLFTPHTWGNGIGVLANLHLAAGVAGEPGSAWVEWPYDPPEWSVDRRDFPLVSTLDEALGLEGGRITLPDRPGLGVDLDHERLARTRSGAATFG
jgi:L-alanine-DL-glutamate epimerase-like enolase superfamily enzyme